jgi:phosphoglycolate phosphatase-like HAD superfamily hydrolase
MMSSDNLLSRPAPPRGAIFKGFWHMNTRRLFGLVMVLVTGSSTALASDPLPSWNDRDAKRSIMAFVEMVTTENSSTFIPVAERIAVFDNDGTLWAEQPMYVQALFTFDRIKQLAAADPPWKDEEPYASVLKGDLDSALSGGEKALLEMAITTHAGMTTEEFSSIVSRWMTTARHPKTGVAFTEMVYQPMLELLSYLREKKFKTFIVSGGGVEFMRPWVERVYGIPPEQVVGSSIETKYEIRAGKPAIIRLPELDFLDDKAGKPVAINRHIGRRPTIAFGNSDGDFEMLEWTTSGGGPRLGALVHHTDGKREWAYDRHSHVGRLARGLDQAAERNWIVIDMKRDWKVVFPPHK